jgi:hypothetical protein
MRISQTIGGRSNRSGRLASLYLKRGASLIAIVLLSLGLWIVI